MTKRRKIVIGNWKMNGRLTSGLTLAKDIADKAESAKPLSFDIVVCPPATLIWPVSETIMGSPVQLGGQNCHAKNHGAYTGEISAGMLADLGCRYVILGHSERRTGLGETSESIALKVAAAQLAGLTVILCVGETQEEHASEKTVEVIGAQVQASLPPAYEPSQLIVAYEPIWAIGTGTIPTIGEIQVVHKTIRKALGTAGETIRVIYGGSVAPDNAGPILAEPEIDGVLIGSVSLNSEGFWAVAEKAR